MADQSTIERYQVPFVQIRIPSTGVTIHGSELVGSPLYNAGVSAGGGFGPGGAEAASLSVTVRDEHRLYAQQIRRGTRLDLYVGYGSDEKEAKFERVAQLYAEQPMFKTSTISFTAYDALKKGDDTAWKPSVFPTTVREIVRSAASQIGLSLASDTMPGGGVEVDLRDEEGNQPDLDMTCRQAIASAVQIGGGFARVNADGALSCSWFWADDERGGYEIDARTIPDNWVMDYTVSEDTTFFSGVKVMDRAVKGTEGALYVLDSNDFLNDRNAAQVEDRLYNSLVGRFGYTADVKSLGDLSIVPGAMLHWTRAFYNEKNAAYMPVVSVRWGGGVSVDYSCETAAVNDLRKDKKDGGGGPSGGGGLTEKDVADLIKDPNSDLRKELDDLYKDEGGGGGDDHWVKILGDIDDPFSSMSFDEAYAYLRDKSWMPMPRPAPGQVMFLMHVPVGGSLPLSLGFRIAPSPVDGFSIQIGSQTYEPPTYRDELGNLRWDQPFRQAPWGGPSSSASLSPLTFSVDVPASLGSNVTDDGFAEVLVTVNLNASITDMNGEMLPESNVVEIAIDTPDNTVSGYLAKASVRHISIYGGSGFMLTSNGSDHPHLLTYRNDVGGYWPMGPVFYDCIAVKMRVTSSTAAIVTNATKLIDLTGSEITNAQNMFSGCYSLVRVIGLDLSNATSAAGCFANCRNILGVGNLNLQKATTVGTMFSGCTNLVRTGDITAPLATVGTNMFDGCSRLESVGKLAFGAAINLNYMFQNCVNLGDFGDLDLDTATSTQYMFQNCGSMRKVGDIRIGKCTNAYYMFRNCYRLYDVGDIEMPLCTNASYMFNNCSNLYKAGDVRFGKAMTNCQQMFSNCYNLRKAGPFHIDDDTEGSITTRTMTSMFMNCAQLSELPDLSGMTGRMTMNTMFSGCTAIKEIDELIVEPTWYQCSGILPDSVLRIKRFEVKPGTYGSASPASNCTYLKQVDEIVIGDAYGTSATIQIVTFSGKAHLAIVGDVSIGDKVIATGFFQNCYALSEIGELKFGTGCSLGNMFMACTLLREVGDIVTPDAVTTAGMFNGCTNLRKVGSVSGGSRNMQQMFIECPYLEDIGTVRIGEGASIYQMFQGCSRLKRNPIIGMEQASNVQGVFSIGNNRAMFMSDLGTVCINPSVASKEITIGGSAGVGACFVRTMNVDPASAPFTIALRSKVMQPSEMEKVIGQLPPNDSGQQISLIFGPFQSLLPADVKAMVTDKGYSLGEWK